MATLLDIVALDVETRKLPGQASLIRTTMQDYKEVLLAMVDIADRIVIHDVGEPPADGKLDKELFEAYFNKCLGKDVLATVLSDIDNLKPPPTADLNYLLARELVLKSIIDYSALMQKLAVSISIRYMSQGK